MERQTFGIKDGIDTAESVERWVRGNTKIEQNRGWRVLPQRSSRESFSSVECFIPRILLMEDFVDAFYLESGKTVEVGEDHGRRLLEDFRSWKRSVEYTLTKTPSENSYKYLKTLHSLESKDFTDFCRDQYVLIAEEYVKLRNSNREIPDSVTQQRIFWFKMIRNSEIAERIDKEC